MICVDGAFYQIKSDGKVYKASLDMLTPFAVVVFFSPDSRVDMVGMDSYDTLKDFLDANIPTQNDFYAIKITGTFKYVRTRSVPRQEKPYPILSKITETQPEFEFTDVKGTLIGFRFPGYMKGVNVAGYHFHFLDEARTEGGHVLDCQIEEAAAEIDGKSKFFLELPRSDEFMSLDLTGDKDINIDKAEN
jgi:acetolactate decarboxylase